MFGGDPDLGVLPLDDYHLAAIIIKLTKRKYTLHSKTFGRTLQRPRNECEVLGTVSSGVGLRAARRRWRLSSSL